ncbi:MAG: hypothetical protein GY759_12850 [Chloroflexi bacterium]|nr:hypothetical protein [Chloroflexota bacterium]
MRNCVNQETCTPENRANSALLLALPAHPGLQVYRSTGLQVYRSTGLPVYRSTGLQVYRLTDT